MTANTTEKDYPIAGHFCGQPQPHDAHVWEMPRAYGAATFVSTYQCAGLSQPPGSSSDGGAS